MNLLQSAATEIFGDNVEPEIVIAMYDRVVRKVRELQKEDEVFDDEN
ncbi:hypothetical protein IQ230_13780 [Gloeocapsopsis crepidinum LEGE 06123]|uniref:Phage protein n=1 Tax=Gloeocapsopsis crepidinum LEGE 06123 TaxID=588587 RepID=A0ABR9UT00_9CHRO|nr:hypothetical protein [Gloeocapsopsis crepidinum]MBE9191396.1 hypothetical protein [Gloeocapsopsis crepidinum LEGE 06123]